MYLPKSKADKKRSLLDSKGAGEGDTVSEVRPIMH